MSHLLVNQKEIIKIMESPLAEDEKDSILTNIFFGEDESNRVFKGGPDMKKMTYEWFINKYSGQCRGFTLLLELN